MKILQTISGFSLLGGGTTTCTYDLINALQHIGVDVDLMTMQSDNLAGKKEKWIKALKNDARTPYGYSLNMNSFLSKSDYDLYHTNGLWMHCNHQTCVEARKKQKPYIITPHGMLYPKALERSAWKKKILLTMGVKKDLENASCIHVTCNEEMEFYRRLGFKNPVAIIPNPVPIPAFLKDIKNNRKQKLIGFLGRLHQRKNVIGILKAWTKLGNKVDKAKLIIMGKGDPSYENKLKEYVYEHNLEQNVFFEGFVSGKEKFEKLACLTALCVPSDFENFGMIVTESLSVKTPVIASLGTPWEILNTNNCGWWVNNDVETLADTIDKALSLSPTEIELMGENGRKLVFENFRDVQVANKMKTLYNWIIYKGEKPNFVYEL